MTIQGAGSDVVTVRSLRPFISLTCPTVEAAGEAAVEAFVKMAQDAPRPVVIRFDHGGIPKRTYIKKKRSLEEGGMTSACPACCGQHLAHICNKRGTRGPRRPKEFGNKTDDQVGHGIGFADALAAGFMPGFDGGLGSLETNASQPDQETQRWAEGEVAQAWV